MIWYIRNQYSKLNCFIYTVGVLQNSFCNRISDGCEAWGYLGYELQGLARWGCRVCELDLL